MLWLIALCQFACASSARAQAGPYVPVGADLLLQGRPAEGLLVLRSGYRNSPFIDADALVFMSGTDKAVTGDVLTISIGVREPHGYGQARLGRFLLSTGAVRPVQIDGASVLARPLSGSTVELFGGTPVVPDFGPRAFDWLAGGRVAQRFVDRIALGVSYLQRRHGGEDDQEEAGVDLALEPSRWLTIAGLGSWDLISGGLAEARIAAAAHGGAGQLELFASRRIAARLLPATSLFSILGDAPSSELGAALSWHAFPRLDLGANAGLLGLDGRWGYRSAVRGRLRLSAADGGVIAAEAVRHALGDEAYTGGSLRVEVPVTARLRPHASIEIAAPDHPRDRGALWPWMRAGTSYALGIWLIAAAAGWRATPQFRSEWQALVHLACATEVQP